MHKLTFTVLALCFCSHFSHLFSQPSTTADSCHFRIGTNLSGPADWGSEWPFNNIMKYSRLWISHNDHWVTGGQNLWDTNVGQKIPADADGYPLYLPYDGFALEAPQVVRTVWANTASLPAGRFQVLWDGLGKLDVWGDAANVVKSGNRISFDLTPGVNNILALEIQESQAIDHVRNVRVLLPNTEITYPAEQFSGAWLDKLQPFKTLRFMDWGYTNNQKAAHWNERTHENDYTFTQKTGVPYEFWVAICNRKQADAWVCVPHRADDDYIFQLATFFKNNLDPGRKIYVEYSNEVWNWGFDQAHYGLDSLDQNLAWPERLAPRIEHVLTIWRTVFGNQSDRLVKVMGCQHGWFDIGNRIFAQIEADGKAGLIDAISPAGYMSIDPSLFNGGFTTATDVLENAKKYSFGPQTWSLEGWKNHAALAKTKGKRLIFYEGGQHFTPDPFGTQQPYCQALLDAQTAPAIYTLYNQLFQTLDSMSVEPELFMNFSFIGPKSCQYGSWGVLENQFTQLPPFTQSAPKYQALIDKINNCAGSPPCPSAPTLSGPTQVCAGYTYLYTAATPGLGSYFWSISDGTILSGQGTGTILVQWNPLTNQIFNGTLSLQFTEGPCISQQNLTVTLSTLPMPWASNDIGNPVKKGDACYDAPTGQLTVRGGGADIFGTTDRFQFVNQPFSGDFTFVARVNSVQNTSTFAKAGLMVRETKDQSSRNVMLGAMPLDKIFMQRRSSPAGTTTRKTVYYQAVPKFFKLTREGNVFKGYRSNDGQTWTLVQAVTVAMSNEVFVGCAVTSKNNTATCTSVFDQISLTPDVLFVPETTDRDAEIEEKTTDLAVFPNPAHDFLTLAFSTETATTADLRLLDLTGREVFFQTLNLEEGDSETPVSLPRLPVGAYILTLETASDRWVKRLLINE